MPTRTNRPARGPDLEVWTQAFPDGNEARELVRQLKRAMRSRKSSDKALVRAKAQFDAKASDVAKLAVEVARLETAIAATAWYGGDSPMPPMEMVRVMADSATFPTDESSTESESSAETGTSDEEFVDDGEDDAGEEVASEEVVDDEAEEADGVEESGSEDEPPKKLKYAFEESSPKWSTYRHPIRTRTRPKYRAEYAFINKDTGARESAVCKRGRRVVSSDSE